MENNLIKPETDVVKHVGKAVSVTNKLLLSTLDKLFVPNGFYYKEIVLNLYERQENKIYDYLGYHKDQLKFYLSLDLKKDIVIVYTEIFTKNVKLVFTKNSVYELNQQQVESFLNGFNDDFEYDEYSISCILQEGIKNKSLTIDFLSRVLNFENLGLNCKAYAQSIDIILFFVDGYLTAFEYADGLALWTRHFKKLNQKLFEAYKIESTIYQGNNFEKVIGNVNAQFTALASTPEMYGNKYIELHKTKFGTVNFRMLLVCHYNHSITLQEFLEVNHGRYSEISQNLLELKNKTAKFRLGRYTYEFSPNGLLLNFSLAN